MGKGKTFVALEGVTITIPWRLSQQERDALTQAMWRTKSAGLLPGLGAQILAEALTQALDNRAEFISILERISKWK